MNNADQTEAADVKSILPLLMRLTICFLIAVMVAFGGGSSVVTRLLSLVLWGALAPLLIFGRPSPAREISTPALIISGLCIGWTYLQISTGFWTVLSGFGLAQVPVFSGIERATLSIAPADSLQTLVTLLLPFAIFLAVLHIFRNEEKISGFIRFQALLGAAIALYGILIYESGNTWLLFSEKRFYLQDLTAVFVNRNTAANYFGIALSCLTALIFATFQSLPSSTPVDERQQSMNPWLLIYAAAWLAVFLALMLTSSRVGAATSILSVGIIACICLYGKRRRASLRISQLPPALSIAMVAVTLFLLIYFSASRIFFRIQSGWSDDLRFCIMPGLLRLWSDNGLFGTGLGTFPLAFPPYKDARCGLAELWLQAHNFYLEGAITFGLPFLFLVLATVAILLRCFVRGLRYRRRYRWVSALGIGLLVQQIIHNAIDFPIQNPAVSVVFASLMAVCAIVSIRKPAASRHESSRLSQHPVQQ